MCVAAFTPRISLVPSTIFHLGVSLRAGREPWRSRRDPCRHRPQLQRQRGDDLKAGAMSGHPTSAVLNGIRSAAANPVLVRLREELASFTARVFLHAGRLLEVDGALLGKDRVEGTSPFGNGSDEVAGDKDAERWLRSTKRDRENFFAPRKIRVAANDRFRGADYGSHCDLGGHPTPLAKSLQGLTFHKVDYLRPLTRAPFHSAKA
jgi:hypothetical protein